MTQKKTTLITGASYGLGFALAVSAADLGHHVIALGRTQGALDELGDLVAQRATGSITLVPMDITDDQALSFLGQSIADRFGRLDYWLHTAWFTPPMQPAPYLSPKDIDRAYRVNVRATTQLVALCNELLRISQGTAVFFNDESLDAAFMSLISMTKTAQINFARIWAEESKNIGPKIQIHAPNPMRTQYRATMYPGEDPARLAHPREESARLWAQITRAD